MIKKIGFLGFLSVTLLLVWLTPSVAWAQGSQTGSAPASNPRRVTETISPKPYNLGPLLSAPGQAFASPWETFRFIPQAGFSRVSPYSLQPGQAWLIENGEIRAGKFDKRRGYQAYNSNLGGITVTKPIAGMVKWRPHPDSAQLVVACSTNLWYDNELDGTFLAESSLTFTLGGNFFFEKIFSVDSGTGKVHNTLCGVNGKDSAFIWDRQNITVWGLVDYGKTFAWLANYDSLKDASKTWNAGSLVGDFIYMPTEYRKYRWQIVQRNVTETLYVNHVYAGCHNFGYYDYQLWSLPIAGPVLDSGKVDSIFWSTIGGVQRGGFCGGIARIITDNTPWSQSDTLKFQNNPYIFQIVGGAGAGIYELVRDFEDSGSHDSYHVWIDSVKQATDPIDTSSVYIVYRPSTPKPKFVTEAKGRVFFAADLNRPFPNHLYFTEEDDPSTTSDEFQMITPISFLSVETDDGDEITGLANQYAELANQFINLNIFKNSHIFELSGNDLTDFQLFEISSKVGCVAPRTIANYKDAVLFLDATGPYFKQGSELTYIGADIRPIIDSIDRKYIHKSSGVVWEDNYYLSYPAGSDTFPSATLCYHIPSGKWTGKFNFGSSAWITSSVPADTFEVQFGDARRGKVYNYSRALTDTGQPITFSWQSYFDLAKPEFTKHWREAWLDYYSADSSIQFVAKNDFDTTTKLTAGLTGSGRQFKVQDLGSKLFNRRLFLDLRTNASSIELGQLGIKVRNIREPR